LFALNPTSNRGRWHERGVARGRFSAGSSATPGDVVAYPGPGQSVAGRFVPRESDVVSPATNWAALFHPDRAAPARGAAPFNRRPAPMGETTPATPPLAHLQHAFLAILSHVEGHGRVVFRHLKCATRKEDAIAEMVALAWRWHLRLAEKGKDGTRYPSALAT